MNFKVLCLILVFVLASISVSFAVSEDFDSVSDVGVDKDELDASGLVEGKDYIINEKGEVSVISGEVNPGDYQWTYGDDSKVKNNSGNYKPSNVKFQVGQLSEDYKNGFEGFVSKLEDMRYYMYWAYDRLGEKCIFGMNALYYEDVPYNASKNLTEYDALNFKYGDIRYHVFTNSDFINLSASQAVPVYVVGDSLYVGNPADNTTTDFKGYAVTDNGFRWSFFYNTGGSISKNNTTTSNQSTKFIVEDINQTNANNISKSINNENVSIIGNDTANADGDNSSNILASAQTSNSLEKTGIPIAILVLVLLSVFGLRRKV